MAEERNRIASKITGDGMPIGNNIKLPIAPTDVKVTKDGSKSPEILSEDAAHTIIWSNYQKAMAYIDQNSWLMEWQYIDYMYQSPNFDRDWATGGRTARISRFDVANNRNTMSCQTRRALFADEQWFILEPRGKIAGNPDAEKIMSAWTEIFSVLSDRADLDYNMRLFIECQTLQGTALAIPQWEQKKVKRETRTRDVQPPKVDMPAGPPKTVNTWASDKFKVITETVEESWPTFEYRRLGTTLYNEKWRHPNRPELSGFPRIDIDYVAFQDLQQLRELDCYKDIPSDEDLETFFFANPNENAEQGPEVATNMNSTSTVVVHATPENVQVSVNPLDKPLMKLAYWTEDRCMEELVYAGRHKIIRNDEHGIGDFAAGFSATWFNIENSGYGFGTGRQNVGDQRMTQGVLNEVLKMIAFPLSAPILYDKTSGNAPTQNQITGLGTMWGVDTGSSHDINKAMRFMEMPQIPPEAWKIYQLAHDGGQNAVGADETTMQGQMGGPKSSFGRTATGANRLSSKADEKISDPVEQLERVLSRWIQFLWKMVLEEMPIKEIREILSDKFGEAILDEIDSEKFMNAKFSIKILCGQKLAAKAAIAQLIPFLLQIVQQPQLLQFLHQKGWTINFKAIEDIFMRMSELAGRDDIFVKMTDDEKQMMQQTQPNAQKTQSEAQLQQLKDKGKLDQIQAKGQTDLQTNLVDKAMEHVVGDVPLELAESRLARNTDMTELQSGIGGQ
jgi:hypothetical protein